MYRCADPENFSGGGGTGSKGNLLFEVNLKRLYFPGGVPDPLNPPLNPHMKCSKPPQPWSANAEKKVQLFYVKLAISNIQTVTSLSMYFKCYKTSPNLK